MDVRAVGKNLDDSTDTGMSLDVQLATSSRELLQQKIRFVEARRPDAQYEELKKRYKPLNSPIEERTGVNSSVRATNAGDSEERRSDGVSEPRVELFPSERIELLWKAPRRVGAGLANLGNTCFLNSVLQCLSYTAPLVNYLQSGDHTRQCRMGGFCAMCEVKRHIDVVLNASGKVVRPMGIVQRLKNIAKHFRVGRQEDAHEFLRYLVDGLQKSCLAGLSKLDTASLGTTVVHRIFGGYHRSQVKCLKCRFESNTYEPLLDISLNIKSCLSVKRSLEKFIEPEMLDGVNRYLCSKCHQKVPAQKRLTVHRVPNVLTLQMKRFEFYSLFGSKLSKEVRYEEKLDLRPFMSCRQGPPEMYQLYAVLVHAGSSCNSGHYYCFVRSPAGHWYCMNDARVYQVSVSTVLGQQAYLLFYARMKPQHSNPAAAKTAAVKPIQPSGMVSAASREFIGPVKPDRQSSNPEGRKLLVPHTNQLNQTPARSASTPGTLSFTPRSLRTTSATDTQQQTSEADNKTSELKKKPRSVSLHGIQKPTAVVPPSPVVSAVPQPPKSLSERVNSAGVTPQPMVLHSPIKSATNSLAVKLPGASVEKQTKQKFSRGSRNALVLLSGYASSDSDKTPSPARIAPATSTTSDGHPTSPDKPQETQLMLHERNKKNHDEVPEGPEPPVESSVREADQSTESQLDKSSGEMKARSPSPANEKKKKKKHKKDKKADKMKGELVKRDKDRHAVKGSKHKHRRSTSSDSLHMGGSRKRRLSGEVSSTDVFRLPPNERLSSEERHRKHRHRHHSSSSSESSDRFSRYRLDCIRSRDGHRRSWSSEEDHDRHKQRRRDSTEQSERQKAKKTNHHYHSSRPASRSPEKHYTDRRFDRIPEKIRWEDTVKLKEDRVPHHARWDGSRHSDVLSELQKSSLHGYGRSVQSWDGGQSIVDKVVEEEHRYRKRKRDIWDEEYDKGKVRKPKKHKTAIMRDNAFQRLQSVKNKLSMVWRNRSH